MTAKSRALIFDGVTLGYLVTAGLFVLTNFELKFATGLESFVIFTLAGAALGFGLSKKGIRTLGDLLFEKRPTDKNAVSIWSRFWFWQLMVSFVVTFGVGLYQTDFSIYELTNPDGFQGAIRLVNGLTHPNWELLPKAITNIIETIYIAFIATALAVPLAFVLSFLSARTVMKSGPARVVYVFLRGVFNVMRAVEPLIWAILFSVWVGIGPFAGMLALMIHSVAALAKQYSELVEDTGIGPIEGIESTGASKLQVIWFGIVPQVVLQFIAFTIYRWDINVRMATVIGLVGGGGIGTMLVRYQGLAQWPEVGCIIVVIAAIVWILDSASARIREALK